MTGTERLDNPVWYSLNETHKNFALDYGNIKFYHPDYCPFGGFISPEKVSLGIKKYALLLNNFFVVGKKPEINDKVQLYKELVCTQMIICKRVNSIISEQIIDLQTASQQAALFDLVKLVQPGYFKKKTFDLGHYYGIYNGNKLIAITGERLKMNGYTEVSSVITHPEYRRKGYARQLVTWTTNKIFNENNIPYLHVEGSNIGAITMYEKLGFRARRKISFWNLVINQK